LEPLAETDGDNGIFLATMENLQDNMPFLGRINLSPPDQENQ
jgi:hypothetical protein